MLCCSPHLFSVVTLLQENKVPFNYACTCESVPLTAAIMLMIKTYRLNKAIQIHNAYVSVITCVRSVRNRQIHNNEGVYATRRWPRLWHCRPRFNHVLNWWLVHVFLQQPPDLVINWVQIWTVGGHRSGKMNLGVSWASRATCTCITEWHFVFLQLGWNTTVIIVIVIVIIIIIISIFWE